MNSPVKSTEVCTLAKAGLKLQSTLQSESIESLFANRIATRELVQKYGFIVFDDYVPATDEVGLHTIPNSKIIEGTLQNAEGSQLLHRDGSGDQDLVLLRYTGQSNCRPADTAIAVHGHALFSAFAVYFLRHADSFCSSARIPRIACELRRTLAGRSLAEAADMEAASSFNHLPWGTFMFQGFGTSVLGHPLLQEFYVEAEQAGIVYLHRWQRNQAVLIDNQAMLHARVVRDDLPELHSDPTPVYRRIFQWNDSVPLPISNHVTKRTAQ